MVDRDAGPTQYDAHSHCHFCGSMLKYAKAHDGGLECYQCRNTNYQNPTPVGVLIIPAGPGKIFAVRRGIEPFIGRLALPGGFVLSGESWQRAAVRETNEELNIAVCHQRDAETKVEHILTDSTPDGRRILIIGTALAFYVGAFVPNKEATERVEYPLDGTGEKLCFPIHEKAVDLYYKEMMEW